MYSLNGIRIRNNNYFNALEMLRGYVRDKFNGLWKREEAQEAKYI